MKPELSIVIPCYNQGKYLEECVGSIFNNDTELPYEIIIVDDASDDDTQKICKEMSQLDNIKTVRNVKNSKLPKTRNVGVKKAKGNLIICLDADDAIPENYINENYKTIIQENADVSYNNSQCFGTSQKLFNWSTDPMVMKKEPVVHCAAMFKKEIWNKLGGFDNEMTNGFEDYDFWLRALQAGYKFVKNEKTYLFYRQTYSNMSNSINRSKLNDLFKKKYKDFYIGL